LAIRSGSASIVVWLKLPSSTSGYRIIVSKRTNANYRGFSIYTDPSGNLAAQWAANHVGPYYTTSATTAKQKMILLCVVLNRSDGTVRMFVDGLPVGSVLNVSDMGDVYNSQAMLIGNEAGSSVFNGEIYETRFYSRAVAVSEISAIYRGIQ
jgi:hypothetical protein